MQLLLPQQCVILYMPLNRKRFCTANSRAGLSEQGKSLGMWRPVRHLVCWNKFKMSIGPFMPWFARLMKPFRQFSTNPNSLSLVVKLLLKQSIVAIGLWSHLLLTAATSAALYTRQPCPKRLLLPLPRRRGLHRIDIHTPSLTAVTLPCKWTRCVSWMIKQFH